MEENGYEDSWSRQAEYRPQEEKNQDAGREQMQYQYSASNGMADRKPEKKSGMAVKLTKCVAIALVFGLVAGASFEGARYFFDRILAEEPKEDGQRETVKTLNKAENPSTEAAAQIAAGDGTLTDVSGIAENVMPAIVAITNMSEVTYKNWFGQVKNFENESAGSGIIVSQDADYLYIATNNHVVANATSLTVQFCDDSTVSAEVKGTDAGNDLAVVAVKLTDIESGTRENIKIATIGTSGSLRVGEAAVAIGNALGYGQSVTTGVISAVNREVSVQDENTGVVMTNELIQTDAAINPGNSGGALLNMRGEVIGINSVKYSDTKVEGMGYAIPIDTASPIIEKLINRELVSDSQTAYLGISGVDVSGSVASTYHMPEGIYVYRVVEGSPAEEAGIAQGDIITKFDGSKVGSKQDLEEQMQYYKAGTQVQITVQRISNENNGEYLEREITVTLGRKN